MTRSTRGIRIALLEVGDSRWDELVADNDPDPYSLRPIVAAEAGGRSRAVLLSATGPGWKATYPLLLTALDGGGLLARSPTYGGPWLAVESGLAPLEAVEPLRSTLDGVLRDMGVVSEVVVLSPWTPYLDVVAAGWQATPARVICTALLSDRDAKWARLGSARRSEVRRLEREGEVRWEPFGEPQAVRFADVYARAMEAHDAADRWRLDEAYFRHLAAEAGDVLRLSVAESAAGGASALFVAAGRRAAYLYAARWGQATGAASAALWRGMVELGVEGVGELLLGGGTSDDLGDSLLRFKRSFADNETSVLVAARIYDDARHQRAVDAGAARPMPPGAVAAG